MTALPANSAEIHHEPDIAEIEMPDEIMVAIDDMAMSGVWHVVTAKFWARVETETGLIEGIYNDSRGWSRRPHDLLFEDCVTAYLKTPDGMRDYQRAIDAELENAQ